MNDLNESLCPSNPSNSGKASVSSRTQSSSKAVKLYNSYYRTSQEITKLKLKLSIKEAEMVSPTPFST